MRGVVCIALLLTLLQLKARVIGADPPPTPAISTLGNNVVVRAQELRLESITNSSEYVDVRALANIVQTMQDTITRLQTTVWRA